VRRRDLMIVSDLLRAVITLGYLFVGNFGLLLGLAALRSTVGTAYAPARDALLPSLVEPGELPAAVAITQTCQQTPRMIGPILGGIVVGLLGVRAAMLVDAATFLLSALLLWQVQNRPVRSSQSLGLGAYWKQMGSGLRFLVKHNGLRSLTGAKAIGLSGAAAVNVLLVAFVSQSVLGKAGLGLLLGMIGTGSVVGSLIASPSVAVCHYAD
jgi:predicted MFS family arabinose efflux permease